MEFTTDIELLAECLKTNKCHILRFLKKNFKENIHYKKDGKHARIEVKRGGSNRERILVTDKCYELVKNSYDTRNKYLSEIDDNIKCVNLMMCLENSTIGFIENSLCGIVKMKRQQIINKYRVDLYFPDTKLIVECDENNHDDRNADYERIREEVLTSLGNKIIHFNPNDTKFDLSNVLREILSIIFCVKTGANIENGTEENEVEENVDKNEEKYNKHI